MSTKSPPGAAPHFATPEPVDVDSLRASRRRFDEWIAGIPDAPIDAHRDVITGIHPALVRITHPADYVLGYRGGEDRFDVVADEGIVLAANLTRDHAEWFALGLRMLLSLDPADGAGLRWASTVIDRAIRERFGQVPEFAIAASTPIPREAVELITMAARARLAAHERGCSCEACSALRGEGCQCPECVRRRGAN